MQDFFLFFFFTRFKGYKYCSRHSQPNKGRGKVPCHYNQVYSPKERERQRKDLGINERKVGCYGISELLESIFEWQGLGTIHAICLLKKTASFYLSLSAPQPDKTKSFSSSLLFSSPFLLSLKHSCTCHLPSSRNLVSSNPAFASLASNLNNYQTFLFHAFSLFFPSAEIPIQHPVFSTNFIRITITL